MVAPASHTSLSRTEVLGLLTACPWTQSNPTACALHDARELPLAERYAIVRHANTDELTELVAACITCPCRGSAGDAA